MDLLVLQFINRLSPYVHRYMSPDCLVLKRSTLKQPPFKPRQISAVVTCPYGFAIFLLCHCIYGEDVHVFLYTFLRFSLLLTL